MKIKNPLTPNEIASGTDGAVAKAKGLHTSTPLWYYILKEAKVRHNGERLGPVGSTIISEVFVGLVHGDQNSYLWRHANWKPTLPRSRPENSPWPTFFASWMTSIPLAIDRETRHCWSAERLNSLLTLLVLVAKITAGAYPDGI